MADGFLSAGPITGPYDEIGDPGQVQAIASAEIAQANQYIVQLGILAGSLQAPVINPSFPSGGLPPSILSTERPPLQDVIWIAPGLPAAFTAVLDEGDFMPDPFDDAPPILNFPTAPASFSEPAPTAPGVGVVYVDPVLTYVPPVPPDLLAISVVPFDGITMPTIDPTVPVLNIVAPSIVPYVPGDLYTSSLLMAAQISLEDRIVNGGTGITPAVENALWDRGREREYRAQRDAIDQLDQMELLGYQLMPGIYADARLKVMTETNYVIVGHSREVMIKAAELEQENVKHALTTAVQLETQLISYNNAVEQRLFDSCKYATEAGVAIYNALVQGYGITVEAYKAKIAVYEAQVRAQLALVEVYKAQIEAEQTKAQINNSLVAQYKVMSDVALASIEVYKAQLAGIQTKAEIEKLKIEIYGEQVRAYATKVSAYSAGVEAYRAQLQAEATKQDAFKSSVEAYSAQVTAGAKQIDARIAGFKGQIDAYTAQLETYKATIAGESARVQGLSTINSNLAEIYKADVQMVTSYNDTQTKVWQVALDQAQRVSEIAVSAAKASGDLFLTSRSLSLDAAKVGAQVSAQLGAAALNAINWSTSISTGNSYSVGYSSSNSNSYSRSNSDSTSTSTSTNTNISV